MHVYVCLSDYFPTDKRLLPCRKGEKFVLIKETSHDPHWVYGISGEGEVGYLPRSYMKLDDTRNTEALEFIDYILEIMHKKAGTKTFTSDQRRALKKLAHIRSTCSLNNSNPETVTNEEMKLNVQKIESSDDNPTENGNTIMTKSSNSGECVKSSQPDNEVILVKENEASKLQTPTNHFGVQCSFGCASCQNGTILNKTCNTTNNTDKTEEIVEGTEVNVPEQPIIPKELVPELIERVRNRTQLSHALSMEAVRTVVECIGDTIPSLSSLWCDEILQQLNAQKLSRSTTETLVIPSKDKEKLRKIFQKLWFCKNDEQQRSWPIHEDENTIRQLLEELIVLLVDANPVVCLEVIKEDNYDNIVTLVTYYQMEPRRSLRLAMLQLFQIMCELDLTVVSCLLNSVLPMEIARDMTSNSEDVDRFKHSARMLTIIFSTGDEPPLPVYEHVNERFVEFLLNIIEDSTNSEEAEENGDSCLALLLAINLHFRSSDKSTAAPQNFIISAIKNTSNYKILLEKLLILFNREADPTCIVFDMPPRENSVMKMLCDVFDDAETAQLFYTNDVRVLLDIVVRQLTDLPASEEARKNYLRLVQNVIRNSLYEEYFHQQEALQKCFSISLSHECTSLSEKKLVEEIVSEFPSWFHS